MIHPYVGPACVAAAAHLALLFGFPPAVRPAPLARPAAPAPSDFRVPLPPPDEVIAVVPADPAELESAERPPPERPEPAPPGAADARPVITPILPGVKPAAGPAWDAVPVAGDLSPERPGPWPGGPVVVRDVELDRPPRARLQPAPVYPAEARRDGRSGVVVVEFVVDESGAVTAPRVARSTDRGFEEAALRAVARWRFEPGRRQGTVVRFRMAVPIHFSLNE